jgi:hypothetical protein
VKLSNLWCMPWNSLSGALVGAALMTWIIFYAPTWIAPLSAAWEARNPVVTPVSTAIVAREDDAVLLRIVGHKHLGEECIILRVYASAIGADGLPMLATVRRPDGAEHAGVTHEAGVRDFGVWRVRPVLPGAQSVIVYAEHSCLGRLRKSKLAEVDL